MDNVCYLFFVFDIIEWFSNPVSTHMRYVPKKTLRFSEVGYRLFHGKFLRFMSGP